MCYWGGPTGTHTVAVPPTSPVILRLFSQGSGVSAQAGEGVGFSAGVPAR